MFLPDKRQVIVFIVPMLSLVGILLAVAIVINTTESTTPNPIQEPEVVIDSECTKDDNYCTYTHEGKEYLVYNNSYKNEYDLQFFNLQIPYSRTDLDNIQDVIEKSEKNKFIVADYKNYQDFCKNNKIKQKYTDESLNYLIYYFNTKVIDDLDTENDNTPYTVNADLGDLSITNKKATLYIWDIIETYHGISTIVDTDNSSIKTVAYSIIIPTNENVTNYEVKPLTYRTDYNEMLNQNPMKGYHFTYDDNKKLVSKTYVNTKNKELNTIINNMLDAISSQHTVKIKSSSYSESEEKEATKTTTFDFINSIKKISENNDSRSAYLAFTPKMTVWYNQPSKSQPDYTEITHSAVNDRSEIFKDFLSTINMDEVAKLNNYRISISETNESFIIKANLIKNLDSDLNNITYYINNKNFLIEQIIKNYEKSGTTYSFNYSQKNVNMPDGIYTNTSQPVFAKPIIYLYPTKTTDVTVKLGHPELLSTSYPKYNDGWTVRAEPSGKLIDKKTGRELYSLYWEGNNSNAKVEKDGFVVKGQDTTKFLEQKLSQLGLSQREAEEFIIYWLPKMEKNKYNYIRFQTSEQINDYMPLNISPKPDTVIRVFMAFKPLERKININEQKLPTVERKGFTVVEWGGTEL